MTEIYFIRHAESDNSVYDDYSRPLTEKGMRDRILVTKFLNSKRIDAVFSSPYKRAIDTVKDFAGKNHLKIQFIDEFKERHVGRWVDNFTDFSKKQWNDFHYKLNEGESLQEVQSRNINALKRILTDYEGKNIVIGTHGTALSTIINYFNPSFGYTDFWNIVDKMPYILHFRFNGMELEYIKKIEIK